MTMGEGMECVHFKMGECMLGNIYSYAAKLIISPRHTASPSFQQRTSPQQGTPPSNDLFPHERYINPIASWRAFGNDEAKQGVGQ